MRRTFIVMAITTALVFGTMSVAFAVVDEVTPSTNEQNRAEGWAHFNVLETRVGEVDIEFVSTRSFLSCFEYRSDGEGPDYSIDNYNPDIEDGLWAFECVKDSNVQVTLSADEYVEIRMVFGAETDERFDWTRVDVLPAPEPGAHGLEIAKSGLAGERANDNARFKQGNENARFNR